MSLGSFMALRKFLNGAAVESLSRAEFTMLLVDCPNAQKRLWGVTAIRVLRKITAVIPQSFLALSAPKQILGLLKSGIIGIYD